MLPASYQKLLRDSFKALELRSRRPATGVSRAFRPRVSRGVSPRVSTKTGVSQSVPRNVPGTLRAPGSRVPKKVSRECPQSVWNTFLTLRRHSRDTCWTLWNPGPEGCRGHPVGHSVGHPRFRGHSQGHSPGHSGPKAPRDPCSSSAGSQL